MTPTATRQKRARGVSITPRDARALKSYTTRIRDAEALWDARAERMSALWENGSSLDDIAASAGLTREAVRRSILRWRERTGWTLDTSE